MILLLLLAMASAPPAQTPAASSTRPMLQTAPRKTDPSACRQAASSPVVVQGGIAATNPDLRGQTGTGAVAIGPKHDDPRAIGPKHDDPSPPPTNLLACPSAG